VDVSFPQMKADLKARRYTFSVSGNPAKIKGNSPRKRTGVPHEWAILDYREKDNHLLVMDPMLNAMPRKRGEWVPANEVRQFAFKDSDGELNVVLRYPVGGWTQSDLDNQAKTKRLVALRRERDKAINDLDHMTERRDAIREKADGLAQELIDCGIRAAQLKEALEDCESGNGTDWDDWFDRLEDLVAERKELTP
jgi:hypothetical protein